MSLRLPAGHYFGETRRREEHAGLVLTESHYAPRRADPRHSHERASICLVLAGEFTERVHSRSVVCTPAMLLFSPSDFTHAEQFHAAGARCFILDVPDAWMERVGSPLAEPRWCVADEASMLARRAYREFRCSDDLSGLALEALVLELMVVLARGPRTEHPSTHRLSRAEELLRANFRRAISLSEVAASIGAHPARLATDFRRHFGCTVGEFARRLRVTNAMNVLRATTMPLADVAADSGFFDQSHFTRVFRKLTGTTPLAWRRAARSR